jgi:hypothetical protein
MAKIKYEKPRGVDLGEVAPVRGISCIAPGNDPAAQPYCPPGNVASGNCWPNGGTAGYACYKTGGKPSPETCLAGGQP